MVNPTDHLYVCETNHGLFTQQYPSPPLSRLNASVAKIVEIFIDSLCGIDNIDHLPSVSGLIW